LAVADVDLQVQPGEIVSLIGPSGCGKTTLLRLMAGLESPTSGTVQMDPPMQANAGGIAFVFQQPTLLPWRTALENVMLPLELIDKATNPDRHAAHAASTPLEFAQLTPKNSGSPHPVSGRGAEGEGTSGQSLPTDSLARAYRPLPHPQPSSPAEQGRKGPRLSRVDTNARERASQSLENLGLANAMHRYPRQLSGGMKMRVSIARALVTQPCVLLLDEPFAALDDMLRNQLGELVLDLWQQQQFTTVMVTHNIAESILLSHRIAVMQEGRLMRLIDNPLPWPRDESLRSSPEFGPFYGKVSAALRGQQHDN
jgi:NitT/TauT family transport system ATP-binding protein